MVTEKESNPQSETPARGQSFPKRPGRRSTWLNVLGPVIVGLLIGLSIAVLAVLVLLQLQWISLNF